MIKEHFVLSDKQYLNYVMKKTTVYYEPFFQKTVKLDQFDVELIP